MRRIEVEKVQCAINCMKIGKASGSSGVAIELPKAGGDKCLKSLTNIFNNILIKYRLYQFLLGKGIPLIQTLIGEYSCWNMLLKCMRRLWMGVCMRW